MNLPSILLLLLLSCSLWNSTIATKGDISTLDTQSVSDLLSDMSYQSANCSIAVFAPLFGCLSHLPKPTTPSTSNFTEILEPTENQNSTDTICCLTFKSLDCIAEVIEKEPKCSKVAEIAAVHEKWEKTVVENLQTEKCTVKQCKKNGNGSGNGASKSGGALMLIMASIFGVFFSTIFVD